MKQEDFKVRWPWVGIIMAVAILVFGLASAFYNLGWMALVAGMGFSNCLGGIQSELKSERDRLIKLRDRMQAGHCLWCGKFH